MKEIKLYTIEDAKKDLEEGSSDPEVALKKWESILNALKAIEEVSVQITSFCLRYQKFNCKGCPILKYDYPCGHPYATYTLFSQELRKLIILGEKLYAILTAIDKEDKERRGRFV
ncbi:MAG TPA: hypothetical protein EYG81_05200 [Archaeoglobus profundus]|nr:hypothetical protein [Archaeoglobus profundus]HIP58082.1 hypothetical protein [Archaeoglobus profundus]